MKKVLMMASVASMIDLFNKENIQILKELDLEVHVVCNFDFGNITSAERVTEFKKELERDNIIYNNLPIPRNIFDMKNIFRSYKELKQFIKDNEFSLIHCHSPIGGVLARLAGKRHRAKGLKIIYTAHGFHFFKGAPIQNWLLFYPIEKYLAKFTDTLIIINKEDYDIAKRFPQTHLEYIPGIGVNTEKFNTSAVKREDTRKELGIKLDDFTFISVGQLSKRKNHAVVLKALAEIKDVRLKYIIIGFGELEKELKQMAMDLNLSDRVLFLGYRSDIKELLHASDCFIFPSLQEGLPVSLMEAMAAGLPIACSKIRGNVDLVQSNENGIFFDPSDEKSVVKAIHSIMTGDKNKMRQNNLTRIKNYDKKVIEKEMINIYQRSLN